MSYLPDPPSKNDWNFSTKLRPHLKLVSTGDVDFRHACTDTNQFDMGACVGNSTADSVEVINALEGKPRIELSRMFLYTLCRNKMDSDRDGRSDIDKDDGTYIRYAFQVLSEFGICTEAMWPYDRRKLHRMPSLLAMREAIGHKIHSYYRITETGASRVDACLAALRSNHPVVFGTQVGDTFKRTKDGSILRPVGDEEGGHAMLMVGYLTGKGFIIKNSWGLGWGENGFCYMAPEYISWEKTRDLWVPTGGTVFQS